MAGAILFVSLKELYCPCFNVPSCKSLSDISVDSYFFRLFPLFYAGMCPLQNKRHQITIRLPTNRVISTLPEFWATDEAKLIALTDRLLQALHQLNLGDAFYTQNRWSWPKELTLLRKQNRKEKTLIKQREKPRRCFGEIRVHCFHEVKVFYLIRNHWRIIPGITQWYTTALFWCSPERYWSRSLTIFDLDQYTKAHAK